MTSLKVILFSLMMAGIMSYSSSGQTGVNSERGIKADSTTSENKQLPTQAEITADSIAATDSFQVADITPQILKGVNLGSLKSLETPTHEGGITVKILVNRKGIVLKAIITDADTGLQVLGEKVIKCLMNSKFEPATLKGKPIPAWVSLSFRFKPSLLDTTVKMDNRINKK